MGLLGGYKVGGPSLFDAVDTPFGGQGMAQKRGGLFGSGYDGEDVMSMLLRAASIAQGDYGSAAQFGSSIGARARAEAEAAAKRQQERDDFIWQLEARQQYERPKPPAMIRNLEEWENLPPERRRALAEMQATLYPQFVTGADRRPYQVNAPPPEFSDDDWNAGEPLGGGASNGTGGFPRR